MIINTVNIDLTWHEDYLIVFLIKPRSEDQANISREMSSDVSSLLSGFTFYFGFGLFVYFGLSYKLSSYFVLITRFDKDTLLYYER